MQFTIETNTKLFTTVLQAERKKAGGSDDNAETIKEGKWWCHSVSAINKPRVTNFLVTIHYKSIKRYSIG